jgi:hypothetical protein
MVPHRSAWQHAASSLEPGRDRLPDPADERVGVDVPAGAASLWDQAVADDAVAPALGVLRA